MIKFMRYWLGIYDNYGMIGIVSHLIPCNFKQDGIIFKNKGYDIISFKDSTGCYYTGKFQNNPFWK